ncbi:MAG: PorV/PorQ family protein [Fermentimonas sp.]|jgi:hypothetical protein
MQKKIIINRCLILLAGIVFSVGLRAQSRPVPLLETPTDARAAAMGGLTLMSTDRSYLYTNPASIFSSDKNFTVSATGLLFADQEEVSGRLKNCALSTGFRFLDRHVIYLGYRYQGGLKYPGVKDQFNDNNKENRPYDLTADLGYAFKINDNFAVFASGNYIRSYVLSAANSASFTIGGNYMSMLNIGANESRLNVAARVADIGKPVDYGYGRPTYSLPSKAELSGDISTDFSDLHRLTFAAGGRYYFLPRKASLFQCGMGAEYVYSDIVNFRAGYMYGENESSLWSAGFGLKYQDLKFDFAFMRNVKHSDLYKTMFTVSYDLKL